MRRGDVVIAAVPGDYGKPRPAIVIQTDAIPDEHTSVVIVLCTSDLERSRLRVTLEPTAENGLRATSQAMADKPTTVHRKRIGAIVGRLSDADLARVTAVVAFTIGLSD